MAATGIFYVFAFVSDLARSKRFYGETLGWTLGTDEADVAGFALRQRLPGHPHRRPAAASAPLRRRHAGGGAGRRRGRRARAAPDARRRGRRAAGPAVGRAQLLLRRPRRLHAGRTDSRSGRDRRPDQRLPAISSYIPRRSPGIPDHPQDAASSRARRARGPCSISSREGAGPGSEDHPADRPEARTMRKLVSAVLSAARSARSIGRTARSNFRVTLPGYFGPHTWGSMRPATAATGGAVWHARLRWRLRTTDRRWSSGWNWNRRC